MPTGGESPPGRANVCCGGREGVWGGFHLPCETRAPGTAGRARPRSAQRPPAQRRVAPRLPPLPVARSPPGGCRPLPGAAVPLRNHCLRVMPRGQRERGGRSFPGSRDKRVRLSSFKTRFKCHLHVFHGRGRAFKALRHKQPLLNASPPGKAEGRGAGPEPYAPSGPRSGGCGPGRAAAFCGVCESGAGGAGVRAAC